MKTLKSITLIIVCIILIINMISISIAAADVLTYKCGLKSTNENSTWNVDNFGYTQSGVTEWHCSYTVKTEENQIIEKSSTPPGSYSVSFSYIYGSIRSSFHYNNDDHIDFVSYNDVTEY